MRTVLLFLALTAASLPVPRPVLAADCEGGLNSCLRKTVLFNTAENWDIIGCQVDYLECLMKWVLEY